MIRALVARTARLPVPLSMATDGGSLNGAAAPAPSLIGRPGSLRQLMTLSLPLAFADKL
jgi:hypothetical protein